MTTKLCDDHAWAGEGECPQCAAIFDQNWAQGGPAATASPVPESTKPLSSTFIVLLSLDYAITGSTHEIVRFARAIEAAAAGAEK